jgi:hypothetical protein
MPAITGSGNQRENTRPATRYNLFQLLLLMGLSTEAFTLGKSALNAHERVPRV